MSKKLPETEDGVTVFPGMTIWYMDICQTDRPIKSMQVKSVTCDMWSGSDHTPYFIRDLKEPYFSNKKAAQYHRVKYYIKLAAKAIADMEGEEDGCKS